MSAAAQEYERFGGGLFYWEAYEPSVKADLSSCAVPTPAGLVVIDPIPLAETALPLLVAEGPFAGIVVTNENHPRASAAWRDRWHLPLWTASETVALQAATGLRVFSLAGAAPGEIALWSEAHGSLHFGDALIHLPPYGFATLPAKYCLDHSALCRSLGALRELPVRTLTFAHGPPIVMQAQKRLAALLAGELS